MKILITGGTGQIGSLLAMALYNLNHKVTVLDKKINKPSYISNLIAKGKIKTISADLNSYNPRRRLRRYDAVFHLAADITDTDNIKKASKAIKSHITGTINLLRYIKQPKYICYASSVMVYGHQDKFPIIEKSSTNPYNFYGVGKLAAENIFNVYCKKKEISLAILRIGSVYGPMKYDLNLNRAIPHFLDAIKEKKNIEVYGDGSNLRDYIYIEDVIDAFVNCLELKKEGIYNIVSGKPISILQLAQVMIGIFNSDSRIIFRKDKPMEHNAVFDSSKAQKQLKWTPSTDLENGLKEMMK